MNAHPSRLFVLVSLSLVGGAFAALPKSSSTAAAPAPPASPPRLVLDPKTVAAKLEEIATATAGSVLIVDCHGNYDSATIQGAIDAAVDGDVVVVLPNTCTPEAAYFENIVFLGKKITVRSLIPEDNAVVTATVIDGDRQGSVVEFQNYDYFPAVLDGFTITNGSASSGGGIRCDGGGPRIFRCVVSGNMAARGGGVSGPTYLEACTIRDNSAVTGAGVDGSHAYLAGCDIINNTASFKGGGVYASVPVYLEDCRLIDNSSGGHGGGIFVEARASAQLKRCSFERNHSNMHGGAAYTEGRNSTSFSNCAFLDNSAGQLGGGIASRVSSASVRNCTFTGNTAPTGGGVYHEGVSGSPPLTLTNTVLWKNLPDNAYDTLVGDGLTIRYSIVGGGWPGQGNLDVDPNLNSDHDYHLAPSSRCINAGDPATIVDPADTDLNGHPRILFGTIDMGADEATEFVDCNLDEQPDWKDIADGTSLDANTNGLPDECEVVRLFVDAGATGKDDGTSWNDAYPELRDALTHALPNIHEIWIARGTYKPASPNGGRTQSFEVRGGLALYGGFAGGEEAIDQRDPLANPTTLSGDLNGDDGGGFVNISDNSYHVVVAYGVEPPAIIDGFTMTGGNADSPDWSDRYGGGLLGYDWGSPQVNNCSFVRNRAYYGGAAYIWGYQPWKKCRFVENLAIHDGGAIAAWGNPVFTDSSFMNNEAVSRGGAFHFQDIWENRMIFHNCTFVGNRGASGGAVFTDEYDIATSIFANCLFSGNVAASSGGALYNGGRPALANCTFYANTAGASGGGIYGAGSQTELSNCILWGNEAPSGSAIQGSGALVRYSDFQGGWPGTGNLSSDPLFVDAVGPDGQAGTEDDDLRLRRGSPCIDRGDNLAVPADHADLDGDGDLDERTPLDFAGAPRFLDDPSTPNLGVPDPPAYPAVVDVGAYEFVPGDLTGDSIVDGDDFAMFRGCHPRWRQPVSPGCEAADLDRDGDVDCADWRWMREAWTAGTAPQYARCPQAQAAPLVDE